MPVLLKALMFVGVHGMLNAWLNDKALILVHIYNAYIRFVKYSACRRTFCKMSTFIKIDITPLRKDQFLSFFV